MIFLFFYNYLKKKNLPQICVTKVLAQLNAGTVEELLFYFVHILFPLVSL